MRIFLAVLLFGFASWTHAQAALTYQKPPAAIEALRSSGLIPPTLPSGAGPDPSAAAVDFSSLG